MDYFSFEKLNVYRQSLELVTEVYVIVNSLPASELYALGSQLRRSIVLVPANIAEGSGRMSNKEKMRFIEIASGSLYESLCHLEVCRNLNYISDEQFSLIKPKFYSISRMLSGLRKSFYEQTNEQH